MNKFWNEILDLYYLLGQIKGIIKCYSGDIISAEDAMDKIKSDIREFEKTIKERKDGQDKCTIESR